MDLRHHIALGLRLGGLVVGIDLAHSLVVVVHSCVVGSSVVVMGRRAAVDRIENIHLPCHRGLVAPRDGTLLLTVSSAVMVIWRLN